MRRYWVYLVGLVLILTAPGTVDPESAVGDDPLSAAARALEQGRPWHASRLLRELDDSQRGTPDATLLAARAAAGRGAWSAVIERLEAATWLDSIKGGAGRALLARAFLETGDPERAAENFRTHLAYANDQPRAIAAQLGLARSLASLDRPEAAAAFLQAAESYPALDPWMAIRAAESVAPHGDTATVQALASRASSVPLERLATAAATAHLKAGDVRGAARVLLESASAMPRGPAANLRARAAQLLLLDSDTAVARGVLRTTIKAAPGSALQAAEILSSLPGLDSSDYRLLARAYERSGAPGPAASHYERYLELTQLSRPERQRLQLKIGDLKFQAGYYHAAITELERLAAENPNDVTRAQAEYLIARSVYRRGWRREGRERLRAIADRYAGSGSALRSLSLLADIYESTSRTAEAREIYDELLQRYADSRPARRARAKLGLTAFLEGDLDSARRHFDRLRHTEPNQGYRFSATYWAARARLASGDPDQAREADQLLRWVHDQDPFGYYGLLAAERVGIDPWADLPEGSTPAPLDADMAQELAAMDLLREAGLEEDASSILSLRMETPPDSPEELLGLAQELAARGYGFEAVRLGWRAHSRLRGRWSASVLRAIYPLAYREIILAEAQALGLDPYLVAAIARRESAFAPNAVSRAGARGLLQIMPATARWLAERLGMSDYDDELLFHPEISVQLGTAYLADLQQRYGELQIALVAYNAGPSRARSWQKRPEYAFDAELFAERIPFSETRDYVRAIQAQRRLYERLYPEFAEGPQPAD
ncbi:MAG: transglycosylase SLT domain-containing protein [Gemmatimonadota bacterium]|nr:MAG: transglycosylase SLT domain-containing protein [Gemmatimonadota bacterium]